MLPANRLLLVTRVAASSRPTSGSSMRSTRKASGTTMSVSSGTTRSGWPLRHWATSVVPDRGWPRTRNTSAAPGVHDAVDRVGLARQVEGDVVATGGQAPLVEQ